MAETMIERDDADAAIARVYEAAYLLAPSVKEEDIESVVGGVRSVIEKAGGSFIAEGAPTLMKLAYPVEMRENDKNVDYDRGYFGWIKFEASVEAAEALDASLKANPAILRSIVFRTVREDTRAKIKMSTMREVKRTDVIKAAPRRAEESAAPVSEADLEKAIEGITTE